MNEYTHNRQNYSSEETIRSQEDTSNWCFDSDVSICLSLSYLECIKLFVCAYYWFSSNLENFQAIISLKFFSSYFCLLPSPLRLPLFVCCFTWWCLTGIWGSPTFLHSAPHSVPQSERIEIVLSSSMLIPSSANLNLLLNPLMNFYFSYYNLQLEICYLFLSYNIYWCLPLGRHHLHTSNSLEICIIAGLKDLSHQSNIKASSKAILWTAFFPCVFAILSFFFTSFKNFLLKTEYVH